MRITHVLLLVIIITVSGGTLAQEIKWSRDGNSYFQAGKEGIIQTTLPERRKKYLQPVLNSGIFRSERSIFQMINPGF